MKNLPYIFLSLAGLLLAGCAAPTGNWDEDTISFNSRLGDQRMNGMRRSLYAERQSLAAEQINQTRLRREMNASRTSHEEKSRELASISQQLQAKKQELADVREQLAKLPPGSSEADKMRDRVSSLVSDVRRLDDIYTSLQQ
jgi:septal ring factor EnvC (AmiA/AmiB activator)